MMDSKARNVCGGKYKRSKEHYERPYKATHARGRGRTLPEFTGRFDGVSDRSVLISHPFSPPLEEGSDRSGALNARRLV